MSAALQAGRCWAAVLATVLGLSFLSCPAAAFQCLSDVGLGPVSQPAKKGIAVDDSTLQWCAAQVPGVWPNAPEPMTSIRLFKAWDERWSNSEREASWAALEQMVSATGTKVLLGTPVTCDEDGDARAWAWTAQLLQRLHPEHVLGLGIGNELELLQFKDGVSAACLSKIWEDGYYWRRFQQTVAEFDALGFGTVPVTAVFTGMGLAGEPFYELPEKARVNSFLANASAAYGSRLAFTWNLYPYFDASMPLDAETTDQCSRALAAASCWDASCAVPASMRHARRKMEQLTGVPDSTLWIGETGWSSPRADSLSTSMKDCPDWSSASTFRKFYEGFLSWDLDIGGGYLPPDHIFWFTMRDSENFGEGEHFGLVATCDEPLCKIRTEGFAPFEYPLRGEPAKRFCGDAFLYDGWAYGETGCRNKCSIDADCFYYSVWPHSHDGLYWCRLTPSCDFLAPTDWEVSIHAKELMLQSSSMRPTAPSTTAATTTVTATATTATATMTTTVTATTATATVTPPTTATATATATATTATATATVTTSSATATTTATTATATATATTATATATTATATATASTSTPISSTTAGTEASTPTSTPTPASTSAAPARTTAEATATTTPPARTSTLAASSTSVEASPSSTAAAEATTTTTFSTTAAAVVVAPNITTTPAPSSTVAADLTTTTRLAAPGTTTASVPSSTATVAPNSTTKTELTTAPTTTTPVAAPGSTTAPVPSSTAAAPLPAPAPAPAANATIGTCEFDSTPTSPGFYWDPSCEMGMLGCDADGKHLQCRFCGAGQYSAVPCPPSSCRFQNEPFVPYYWDQACEMGRLGCWADGIHAQCRFCGDSPFTSVPCPTVVAGLRGHPDQRQADGKLECSFANEPLIPYFWDADCVAGKLGCLADGIHEQCRFCARRPFEDIDCPANVAPDRFRCTFPGSEPETPFFWDESCRMGDLGCWADGIHQQCRFCGSGLFEEVLCPTVLTAGAETATGARAGQSALYARDVQPASTGYADQDDDEVAELDGASPKCAPCAAGALLAMLLLLPLASMP